MDKIKAIGAGYCELNRFDSDGKPLYPLEEYEKIRHDILNDFTSKRGEFIAKCIDVDQTLGDAIQWFFFKHNMSEAAAFRELVLNQPTFSFRKKFELVQSLVKKYPDSYPTIAKKNDFEIFKAKLNSIIRIRNLLAHGELCIDYKTKQAILSKYYTDEQITRSEPLPDFKDFQKDIKWVINYCHYHLIFPDDTFPVNDDYEYDWKKIQGIVVHWIK